MKSFAGIAGALLFATLLAPSFAESRAPRTGGSSGSHSNHSHSRSNGSRAKAVPGVRRDSHGRIKRSASAKHDFQKSHPCPSSGKTSGACPGYVIDHVTPLKRGGADSPGNMQWQTKEAAKIKDKTE
jgi:hypothetical protein